MLVNCPSKPSTTMRLLPEDFTPTKWCVVFGRGRKISIQNRYFRELVNNSLAEYSQSGTKLEKSFILRRIVDIVRSNCPVGGFVKRDPKTGRWYEVGDFLAREKTSQAFRDALFEQYKSSNTAKRIRRLQDLNMDLPQRSYSSMDNEFTGSNSDNNQLTACPEVSQQARSCPNFDKNACNLDESVNSMRNFDWEGALSPKPKAAVGFLADTFWPLSCREASAKPTLKLALQEQTPSRVSIGSLPFFSDYSDSADAKGTSQMPYLPLVSMSSSPTSMDVAYPQGNCSFDATQTTLAQTAAASATKETSPSEDQSFPAYDIFERLLSLAGNFITEGDPYKPEPMPMNDMGWQSGSGCKQLANFISYGLDDAGL